MTLKSGQRSLKVIESGTIRQIVYGFLLEFFSNIVPKMRHFWYIQLQKCHDLENWDRGPSRSLEMSPCDRAHDFLLTFYSNYDSISCRFWDIQCWKMLWHWNLGQRSLNVIERGTILYKGYGFLLVFYRNFVPNMHRFSDIRLQ